MPPLPLTESTALPQALVAVLQRRGVQSQEELQSLLQPDPAPEAKAHFPDLECAVQRLLLAFTAGQQQALHRTLQIGEVGLGGVR